MRSIIIVKLAGVKYGVWSDEVQAVRSDLVKHCRPYGSGNPCITGTVLLENRFLAIADLSSCLGYPTLESGDRVLLLLPAKGEIAGFVTAGGQQRKEIEDRQIFSVSQFAKNSVVDSCVIIEDELIPVINISILRQKLRDPDFKPVLQRPKVKLLNENVETETQTEIWIRCSGNRMAINTAGELSEISPPAHITRFPSNRVAVIDGLAWIDEEIIPMFQFSRKIRGSSKNANTFLLARVGDIKYVILVESVIDPISERQLSLPEILHTEWMSQSYVSGQAVFPVINLNQLLLSRFSFKSTLDLVETQYILPSGTKQIVEVVVQGERFAIPRQEVVGVTRIRTIQSIPKQTSVILGAIIYRGMVIPVLDLAACYDQQSSISPDWRLVLIQTRHFPVFLAVEKVFKPKPLPHNIFRDYTIRLPFQFNYGCYFDNRTGRQIPILNIQNVAVYSKLDPSNTLKKDQSQLAFDERPITSGTIANNLLSSREDKNEIETAALVVNKTARTERLPDNASSPFTFEIYEADEIKELESEVDDVAETASELVEAENSDQLGQADRNSREGKTISDDKTDTVSEDEGYNVEIEAQAVEENHIEEKAESTRSTPDFISHGDGEDRGITVEEKVESDSFIDMLESVGRYEKTEKDTVEVGEIPDLKNKTLATDTLLTEFGAGDSEKEHIIADQVGESDSVMIPEKTLCEASIKVPSAARFFNRASVMIDLLQGSQTSEPPEPLLEYWSGYTTMSEASFDSAIGENSRLVVDQRLEDSNQSAEIEQAITESGLSSDAARTGDNQDRTDASVEYGSVIGGGDEATGSERDVKLKSEDFSSSVNVSGLETQNVEDVFENQAGAKTLSEAEDQGVGSNDTISVGEALIIEQRDDLASREETRPVSEPEVTGDTVELDESPSVTQPSVEDLPITISGDFDEDNVEMLPDNDKEVDSTDDENIPRDQHVTPESSEPVEVVNDVPESDGSSPDEEADNAPPEDTKVQADEENGPGSAGIDEKKQIDRADSTKDFDSMVVVSSDKRVEDHTSDAGVKSEDENTRSESPGLDGDDNDIPQIDVDEMKVSQLKEESLILEDGDLNQEEPMALIASARDSQSGMAEDEDQAGESDLMLEKTDEVESTIGELDSPSRAIDIETKDEVETQIVTGTGNTSEEVEDDLATKDAPESDGDVISSNTHQILEAELSSDQFTREETEKSLQPGPLADDETIVDSSPEPEAEFSNSEATDSTGGNDLSQLSLEAQEMKTETEKDRGADTGMAGVTMCEAALETPEKRQETPDDLMSRLTDVQQSAESFLAENDSESLGHGRRQLFIPPKKETDTVVAAESDQNNIYAADSASDAKSTTEFHKTVAESKLEAESGTIGRNIRAIQAFEPETHIEATVTAAEKELITEKERVRPQKKRPVITKKPPEKIEADEKPRQPSDGERSWLKYFLIAAGILLVVGVIFYQSMLKQPGVVSNDSEETVSVSSADNFTSKEEDKAEPITQPEEAAVDVSSPEFEMSAEIDSDFTQSAVEELEIVSDEPAYQNESEAKNVSGVDSGHGTSNPQFVEDSAENGFIAPKPTPDESVAVAEKVEIVSTSPESSSTEISAPISSQETGGVTRLEPIISELSSAKDFPEQPIARDDLAIAEDKNQEIVDAEPLEAETQAVTVDVKTDSEDSEQIIAVLKEAVTSETEEDLSYTVKKGDYLINITRRYTGNGYDYPKVARENRIKNADLIYPDQIIRFRSEWLYQNRKPANE